MVWSDDETDEKARLASILHYACAIKVFCFNTMIVLWSNLLLMLVQDAQCWACFFRVRLFWATRVLSLSSFLAKRNFARQHTLYITFNECTSDYKSSVCSTHCVVQNKQDQISNSPVRLIERINSTGWFRRIAESTSHHSKGLKGLFLQKFWAKSL